jgi:hypothetical protein
MYSLIEKLSQELTGQFILDAGNSTASATNATLTDGVGLGALSNMAVLWKLLATFGIARDWIKLFLLGSVLETIRRFAGTIWSSVVNSFFLTASFESDDDAYNWMMIWIAKQPVWSNARDVQVSTKVCLTHAAPVTISLTLASRVGALTLQTTHPGASISPVRQTIAPKSGHCTFCLRLVGQSNRV